MNKKKKKILEQVSQVIQANDSDSSETLIENTEGVSKSAEDGLLAAADGQTENEALEIEEGSRESEAPEHNSEQETHPVQLELIEDETDQEVSETDSFPKPSHERTKQILESLIFVAEKPVTPVQLSKTLRRRQPEIRALLKELTQEYATRGVEIVEIGGGFAFRSAASNAAYVREFLASKPVRLTRAQLETLAIVAYRQPVTRPEIEDIRGVDTGSAIRVLLERGLIKMLGRKDEAGRPLLYGTTPYFLEFFGLKGLADLPTLREFSDLTQESRDLFQRKTGETLGGESTIAAGDSAGKSDTFNNEGDLETETEFQDKTDDSSDENESDNGIDPRETNDMDDEKEAGNYVAPQSREDSNGL